MSSLRYFAAALTLTSVLLATPALAVINITSDEVWDGIQNPHAADGVMLTTTGSIATNNLVSTYTIPTGVTIAEGVNVFLHDISNPNFSSAINWNFTPNAGPLTFEGPNSTFDTTKGGRNNPGKAFTLNMDNNSIVQSTPGAGRFINGVFVLGGMTGDTLSVTINAVGTASVAVGTIDTAINDAFGGPINITTRGNVDVDNLRTSDVSAGGGSSGSVNVTSTSMTIGNVDTRTFRTSGASAGNVNLRALGQPANSPGDFNANTLAQNTIVLDGTINTNGPQGAGGTAGGGNITTNAVKTTLEPSFMVDLNEGATFTVNTGALTSGTTQAQVFVNNSSVTPNTVNFNVFHDGAGPAAVQWAANASGNWNTAANWSPTANPMSTNTVATIGGTAGSPAAPVITSPQTIYINSTGLAKGLVLDSAAKVAVAGPGTLTLESNSGNASLNVMQGSHELQAQLTLGSNTDATTAANSRIDLNGVLNLAGKTLNTSGAGVVSINNAVVGSGTIVNAGVLGTGGTTAMVGNLTSTGTLAIDIGGTGANRFDAWSITGNATVSGVLSVDAVDGFTPTGGQTFTVLTATNVNAAGLTLGGPDASLFNLITNSNSLVLQAIGGGGVAGDYNGNGVVDAADYVVWRNGGSPDSSQAGYALWRTNFGRTSGGGSIASAGAVPEPASVLLVSLAGFALAIAGRRRN